MYAKRTSKSTIQPRKPQDFNPNVTTIIKGELSICIQKAPGLGMISLDDFQYEAYNNDFGPLTVHDIITLGKRVTRETILHIGSAPKLQSRGVCLVACYLLYCKKYSIPQVIQTIGSSILNYVHHFRDAGVGPADYPISIQDVLRGLDLGIQHRWVTNDRFQELSNLDCSWVVPGRILACASPSQTISKQYPSQSPEKMISLFKQIGVKAVIRLNEALYDARQFERSNIKVFDLEFPDGSCPPENIIKKFIQIMNQHEHTGVAVHCRAGLGRTGTLIGCYLMQKHKITDAKALIAWMRLCRPGMVVGDQQQFLDARCRNITTPLKAQCLNNRKYSDSSEESASYKTPGPRKLNFYQERESSSSEKRPAKWEPGQGEQLLQQRLKYKSQCSTAQSTQSPPTRQTQSRPRPESAFKPNLTRQEYLNLLMNTPLQRR